MKDFCKRSIYIIIAATATAKTTTFRYAVNDDGKSANARCQSGTGGNANDDK